MQKGTLKEGNKHCVFIELKSITSNPIATFTQLVKNTQEIHNVEIVIAFSKAAWNTINPDWTPEKLKDFETLTGKKGYSMPSTQADIMLWAHTNSKSDLFDFTESIKSLSEGTMEVLMNQEGFIYKDSRDLTGFVDGTGNPKEEKIIDAACIPQGEKGSGGSYVFTQKWNHNLKKFNQESIHTQEKIIGRTKVDSIELEGDAMPKDSHVSKTDLKISGEAMKIYRRSYPFANQHENGLYFLAFACDPIRIDVQLESMLGNLENETPDRLMEFSTPVSGAYYFAPSFEDLNKLL
ncbi:Dyp-type peroxidase [Flavicella marina]|uniref:Dyp-type peroxidase n=1 Tax=Flavicella marina TaxID=1475951 RepID=UPI001264DC2F|nr:Dyp-type peroxidase [Flavicella marina]